MTTTPFYVDRQTPINEALFKLGYRIKQTQDPAARKVCRGDMELFSGTDPMIWRWLMETNQVEFRKED